MTTTFLHGAEVVSVDASPPSIATVQTSIIGVVGTARLGPVNTPTQILARGDAAVFGDPAAEGAGTLPAALRGIYDQVGARVAAVNAWARTAVADAEARFAAGTIQLGAGAVTGGMDVQDLVVKNSAGDTTYVAGTDYTIDAATGVLSRVAAGGIAANAAVKVSYSHLPPPTAALLEGAATGTAYTGVHALLQASARGAGRPKILCCPRWSQEEAVRTALLTVAERLRAVAVIDGPNTTNAAARLVPAAIGSRRAYVVDPYVLVGTARTPTPASPYVAGVIAATDADPARGFWWSPSNRPIRGIVGTARAIDFELGAAASAANVLNEGLVATIINEGGWRLWGNRTTAGLSDKWTFLSVSRVADAVDDSIMRAHLWAVDRNITRTYLEQVTEGVNGYLQELEAQGAILGGRAWVDPAKNPKASLKAGKVTISYDFQPPPPAERITFESAINDEYLARVFG